MPGATFAARALVLMGLLASGQAPVPSNVRLLVPPLPPPVSTSTYGPQKTITCPAGAIPIAVGSSIQAAVTANAGATTFCLKAGIFPITSAIVPKSGNTFVGEYGAILDGSSWTTTDSTQAAFRAHNEDIDDVTIRNLVIRNMPQRGIHAYYWQSDRWTIEDCEIANNLTGLTVPNASVVRRNRIHHNVGVAGASAGNGGGYGAFRATGVQFLENEFFGNGSEQKIVHAFNVIFRGNYFHNETHNAIWFDGDSPGSIVEDNRIEDIPIFGIFLEVAQQITVRRNTIRRAGWNAIALHTSREIEVSDNVIEDAGSVAIALRMECSRIGGGDLANKWDLTNNVIRDNTIRVPAGGTAGGLLVDQGLAACANPAAYLASNAKRNTWTGNRYTVPNVGASLWYFPSAMTWAQWQALQQDVTGTVR